MELTEAQKFLIRGLMLFGVEKEAVIGIVSALEKPEQVEEMIEWLYENRTATTSDILRKTVDLTKD